MNKVMSVEWIRPVLCTVGTLLLKSKRLCPTICSSAQKELWWGSPEPRFGQPHVIPFIRRFQLPWSTTATKGDLYSSRGRPGPACLKLTFSMASIAPVPMPHATNGTADTTPLDRPIELALPLPNSPGQCLNLHLTIRAAVIQLFVTTSGESLATVPGIESSTGSVSAMGSLVFAMPDVRP